MSNVFRCKQLVWMRDASKLPINDFKWVKKFQNLMKIHKKQKNWKSRKTHLQYRRQRKICYSYRSFQTNNKSWINAKESTQSNSI